MRIMRAVFAILLFTSISVAQYPANRTAQAMVTIRGNAENGSPVTGTGFLVAANGTIVTNLHLVKGLTRPQIELASGDIFDSFTIVNSDARRDLAIIRIAGFDLPHLELGNSNLVKAGDSVVLVPGARTAVTPGKVKDVALGNGFRLIQTSAPPEVGAGGGVLLSAKGEAVGVLGYPSAGQNSMAVPINYARGLLQAPETGAAPEVAAAPENPAPAAPAVTTAPPPKPGMNAIPATETPVNAATEPAPPSPVVTKPAPPAPVATKPAPEPAAQPEPAAPTPPKPAPPEVAATPRPEIQPKPAEREYTEVARPRVRKIYIESLGSGEGPDMLRDKIAQHLQELHFKVVDTPGEADAVLSGSGKWDHVRVQRFRARLVAGDQRELWSGEVSVSGWLRSASSSVANKLVENMTHALAVPAE
ncbi:MAG: S1C family serine protease [Terriglobales bacterium]